MNREQALVLARAIRGCKSQGGCVYPQCKQLVAPCWTKDEIAEAEMEPVMLIAPRMAV